MVGNCALQTAHATEIAASMTITNTEADEPVVVEGNAPCSD